MSRAQLGEGLLFREVQSFRQWWITVIVLVITAGIWLAAYIQLIRKQPVGNNPAPDSVMVFLWVVFGLAFPVLWFMIHLTVEVYPDYILIRFSPFLTRRIALSEIRSFEARQYNAIMEYGGWGMRYGWGKQGRAYNVSGNLGVQLVLSGNERVLIGTQQPDEFVNALEFARKLG